MEWMKFLENFLSLGFGFPVTHRSAFVIRLNGGQERYYYSLDRASYKENYYEDLTTLNYISPKLELRRMLRAAGTKEMAESFLMGDLGMDAIDWAIEHHYTLKKSD